MKNVILPQFFISLFIPLEWILEGGVFQVKLHSEIILL